MSRVTVEEMEAPCPTCGRSELRVGVEPDTREFAGDARCDHCEWTGSPDDIQNAHDQFTQAVFTELRRSTIAAGLIEAALKAPRSGLVLRSEDMTGCTGTGHVAYAHGLADGAVVVMWLPGLVDVVSVSVYASERDFLAVHGHDGRTRIEWDTDV